MLNPNHKDLNPIKTLHDTTKTKFQAMTMSIIVHWQLPCYWPLVMPAIFLAFICERTSNKRGTNLIECCSPNTIFELLLFIQHPLLVPGSMPPGNNNQHT
jgi:hypothetical protein